MVLQRFIFGRIVLKIFLTDLFFVIDDTYFTRHADDNSSYSASSSIDDVIPSLQDSAKNVSQWFSHNQIRGNTEKCNFLSSKCAIAQLAMGDSLIKNSTFEKTLGVKINNKPSFDERDETVCRKANIKLRALAKVTTYTVIRRQNILLNTFSMLVVITTN